MSSEKKMLLLLILLICLRSSVPTKTRSGGGEVGNTAIRKICARTTCYPLCRSVLSRDPRSNTSDLTVFGQITIDATRKKLKSYYKKIQTLIKNYTDPVLKKILYDCQSSYHYSATADIEDVQNCLNSEDYQGFKDSGGRIDQTAVGCGGNLRSYNSSSPPFKTENQNVRAFANMIATIGNLLKNHGDDQ